MTLPPAVAVERTGEVLTRGWTVLPDVFEPSLVGRCRGQLQPALERRARIRLCNGVEGPNDGTLHHLLGDHPCFLEILEKLENLDLILRGYFSGNYILNSYGGVVNERESKAYVHAVHRDIRFSSDSKRFMLNLLVMLDDFTVENGATHILSASQSTPERPGTADFMEEAERAVGRSGSLLIFDSRLWHAAGDNETTLPRRALTITLTSPFFKPQLDHVRQLGEDNCRALAPYLRQLVGYNARVPTTLEEYYVPVRDRFYQRGQDD